MGNTPKFPSLASPLLILKGFWFWDQDAKILPCTMFRGPSAGPGRSVVSANNLDREVKGHGKFEHRPASFGRIFSAWERVFVSVISMIYYVSIITLTWRDICIKRWQFSQVPRFIQSSNVQHSQVSVTLVTFTHPERFLILGTGCKDIALYNVQGSITRSWQISGQCKQSGSQREKAWTFWKEAGIFWKSLQHLGKGMWDMISINHDESMIYYVSIITLTWRDSCIKRWQFSTSTVYHPKLEWATLPSFRHFRHLHSSWKGFDTGIRMQAWCLVQCSVQCSGVHQLVCANNLNREVKRHGHFEKRSVSFGRVFNTWKGYLWDIISMIYYVSIITLTWLDSSIKRWQFWTSTSYHPKFEWATLPSFRHFRHLHSSWKGFDSGIRMQGYCFVQCSGVRQQVLADQWSVQTIWIARWKGIENWNIGRHLLEESSTPRKGHVRYDID